MEIRSLRNAFLTGVALLLPLGAAVFVINFLLKSVGGPVSQFALGFFAGEGAVSGWVVSLLELGGVVVVVGLVTGLGILSRYFLGRWVMKVTDQVVSGVPLINQVYGTVKQIVETFRLSQGSLFNRVVMVEFPRKGSYAIGFVTGECKGEVQEKTKEDVVNVFVPTTPNPTSGFLVLVPRSDIIELTMSVSDGMKLIISGGTITPGMGRQETLKK